MEEYDEANKGPEPAPEEETERLLKLLELQHASLAARGRRSEEARSFKIPGRYLGLIFVVAGTLVAVFFLEWMASQITRRPQVQLKAMPTPPGWHRPGP